MKGRSNLEGRATVPEPRKGVSMRRERGVECREKVQYDDDHGEATKPDDKEVPMVGRTEAALP